MNSQKVDSFNAKLNNELSALSRQQLNELLVRIGRQELKMRSAGQERPVWNGPLPEAKILGTDVVVPTEQGDRRGRVICFGIVNMGSQYERSVVIHVPSSGTQHEAAGSLARLAGPEDLQRIQNEMEMAERLSQASKAAQEGIEAPTSSKKTRKRGERDPELVERMRKAAIGHPNVSAIEEGGANYKVVGVDQSKRIYLFKNQLRVDVSGFSFDHPGLRSISDEEARDMHLGKVRGQILYDDRETAFAAFEEALRRLV